MVKNYKQVHLDDVGFYKKPRCLERLRQQLTCLCGFAYNQSIVQSIKIVESPILEIWMIIKLNQWSSCNAQTRMFVRFCTNIELFNAFSRSRSCVEVCATINYFNCFIFNSFCTEVSLNLSNKYHFIYLQTSPT